jgi:serine/threonine protein kinase
MALEGLQLGRYRLLRQVGSGGMGEVYLAEDTALNRQVAVKVIRPDPTSYPTSNTAQEVERLFQREAKAVAMLDHPHILPLFDYGEVPYNQSRLIYLVMPYRAEGTLSNWLQRNAAARPLSPQDVAALIQQAADALQFAHTQGIIHQDVKPSNFLIRGNTTNPQQLPDLLLADFGVATFASATSQTMHHPRGTPTYMAPEQWEHRSVPASDQYALAIMTYDLLTGTPPFRGNLGQLMFAHMRTPPPPPTTHNPRLSPALDHVLLRALAKKPEERFPSIAEFALALQQATGISPSSMPGIQRIDSSSLSSQSPNRESLRATLAISQAEALYGTQRTLNLPGGKRVQVSVPPGVRDGQVISVDSQSGQQKNASQGSTGQTLLLNITVQASTIMASPPPIPPEMPTLRPHRIPVRRTLLLVGLVLLVIVAGGLSALYFLLPRGTEGSGTPTGKTTNNPYPPHTGTLVLDDPLSNNSQKKWREDDDTFGDCQFTGNAYHVTMSLQGIEFCLHKELHLKNFAYEIQMTLLKGKSGGLVIRAAPTSHLFYYCFLGKEGTYGISVYSDKSDSPIGTIASGSSPVIHKDPNQSNTLAVVANSTELALYANGQLLKKVTDSTYDSGLIGVASYSTINTDAASAEAVFTNARIWQL